MAEWVPLKFFTGRFPYVDVDFPFFKVILLISAGSLIFTRRRRDAFEVLLLAGLVIGGLVHIRHTVFFCIAAAMFIPKHLESAIRARWTRGNSPPLSHLPLPPPNLPGRRAQRVMKTALVFALILGVTAAGALYGVYTPWRIPMKTAHFPMRAVQFIRDNGIRGNLAVWFNWAQFVLWRLGPDSAAGKPAHNLLAYDGRYRNVYPPGAEQAYMAFSLRKGVPAGRGANFLERPPGPVSHGRGLDGKEMAHARSHEGADRLRADLRESSSRKRRDFYPEKPLSRTDRQGAAGRSENQTAQAGLFISGKLSV